MNASTIRALGAAACGLTLAVSAHAAEMTIKKGEPASVSESAPDRTGKEMKGKSGKAVMPSKGPSSVSESAPSKTGKERPGKLVNDNKDMPNPKTPSGSSESAPTKPR